uniref:Uncharacterized protein n=1 Tax=Rhizophora mucronata TaxID=61149 RepID=A0A2P2PSD7_RHIMU
MFVVCFHRMLGFLGMLKKKMGKQDMRQACCHRQLCFVKLFPSLSQ